MKKVYVRSLLSVLKGICDYSTSDEIADLRSDLDQMDGKALSEYASNSVLEFVLLISGHGGPFLPCDFSHGQDWRMIETTIETFFSRVLKSSN